jgi:hypothetical protein
LIWFFIFKKKQYRDFHTFKSKKIKTCNHGYLCIFKLFVFFVINRLDWGQLDLLIFLILIKKLLTRATSMWCCLMSKHRLSKLTLEVAHCVLSNDVWHVTNREVRRLRWIFSLSSLFSFYSPCQKWICHFIYFLYLIWSSFFWLLFILFLIFLIIFFLQFHPHHLISFSF